MLIRSMVCWPQATNKDVKPECLLVNVATHCAKPCFSLQPLVCNPNAKHGRHNWGNEATLNQAGAEDDAGAAAPHKKVKATHPWEGQHSETQARLHLAVRKDRNPLLVLYEGGKQILCCRIDKCGDPICYSTEYCCCCCFTYSALSARMHKEWGKPKEGVQAGLRSEPFGNQHLRCSQLAHAVVVETYKLAMWLWSCTWNPCST